MSTDPTFHVRCPKCNTGYDVPAAADGKRTACRKCGERFVAEPVADAEPYDDAEWEDYRRVVKRAAGMVYWTMYLVWMFVLLFAGLQAINYAGRSSQHSSYRAVGD